MNEAIAKGFTTFFSIAIIAMITWTVSACCFFLYYHCRKESVDTHEDGALTEMISPKSGADSDIGECQIQIDQPTAV